MNSFSMVNATSLDESETEQNGHEVHAARRVTEKEMMMITGSAAREDLGALEHVLDAVRRVDHVVLRQIVPHVPVLVVPSSAHQPS
jgi:hypothetical protein